MELPGVLNLEQAPNSIKFERESGPPGGYRPSEWTNVIVMADGETVTFERGEYRWYCDQGPLAEVITGRTV